MDMWLLLTVIGVGAASVKAAASRTRSDDVCHLSTMMPELVLAAKLPPAQLPNLSAKRDLSAEVCAVPSPRAPAILPCTLRNHPWHHLHSFRAAGVKYLISVEQKYIYFSFYH